jgi:DNA gyrase subunit A
MSQSANTAPDIRLMPIEEEMKRSYLDYAMSVIVSRALPDVRDGLKPVHRRILYAMKEAGNEYNKPYRKSARVVGDVMGKYHPHGNMAIYDAMVRLTQDFSLRLPLIDGQGNFGSMDGDPPAAERYTEARLSKPAHELLSDIDQDTVDFQANYDDTLTEPKVLPARFPNLLVNGANGIAVGMATSIPTHNLGEIIEACHALIDNPELTVEEIIKYVPGPDFPTGGTLYGRGGLLEAYRTGRGSVILRGKSHFEDISGGRQSIVITEIPFQVNKARLIEKFAELVKDKIIEGISDLRDESDREGVRVVVELKRDAVPDVVLNQLYKHTQLQGSVSFNMLALHQGRPEQLSLKRILAAFLDFREEVILRRTRFELYKAREKAHTLLGFALAVANIDPVISLIRGAKDRVDAKEQLMARDWDSSTIGPMIKLVHDHIENTNTYRLDETQANAILDLRLHRLTGLEREKIRADLDDVIAHIQDYLAILGSRERVLNIMKEELNQVKEQFATPRKTVIEDGGTLVDMEDLIQPEDSVITLSVEGYVKRVSLDTYRAQRRGGKGRSGMTTHEEDAVSQVLVANTHDFIYFFSTRGRVYAIKGYRIPQASPQSKGRALVNILPLEGDEKIATILVLPASTFEDQNQYLMFSTSMGRARRNRLEDFKSIQSNGKKAMVLDDNEEMVNVALCRENDHVLMTTSEGICNRFAVSDVRVFAGRDSNGVRGIKLKGQDFVVSCAIIGEDISDSPDERAAYLKMASKKRGLAEDIAEDGTDSEAGEEGGEEVAVNEVTLTEERFNALEAKEEFILTITDKGFGKKTSSYEYRTTSRGSQGFAGIITSSKNGKVVASMPVEHEEDLILVTHQGQIIRCPVNDIRTTGRRTQGVIVFRVEDDRVSSCVKVKDQEEE